MDKNLSKLNSKMKQCLTDLGATHYSVAFNYDKPLSHKASSVHFFSSDKVDENGLLTEVASFNMDLHSEKLGELSGFKECTRKNGIDTQNLKEFVLANNTFEKDEIK